MDSLHLGKAVNTGFDVKIMKKYLFILLLLVLALVACANQKESVEKESTHSMDHASSGLQVDESLEGLAYNIEKDAWSPMMVQFLGEVDDSRVQGAYELAINYPDVLESMPCYCGCYESNGHESNKHCFIDEFNGDTVTPALQTPPKMKRSPTGGYSIALQQIPNFGSVVKEGILMHAARLKTLETTACRPALMELKT